VAKNVLFYFASVGALSVALSMPASAQVTQPPQRTVVTETVIVTARKREENVQDIPAVVTALSAQNIKDLGGATDTRQLVQLLPGVTFIDSATSQTSEPNIRGAGQARLPNSDAAIGLYRDGAYIAGGNLGGRTFQRFDLFDVERVEVLRGPQGALYGRNAVGGAINALTQRPLFSDSGSFTTSFGERETFGAQAIYNVALSDSFALRFGADHTNQTGCIYIRSDNRQCYDRQTYGAVRAGVRWKPSNRLDIAFVADYSDSNADSGGATLLRTGNPPRNVVGIDGPNGRSAAQSNFNMAAKYELGWADLFGTINHRKRSSDLFTDPNGVSTIPQQDLRIDISDTTFAEIRLQGDTPRMNWLVGADVFLLNSDYDIRLRGRAPIVNTMTMVTIDPNTNLQTVLEQRSYAAYGSLDFKLTDKLTLQGEIRYSVDNKDAVVNATLLNGQPRYVDFPPGSPQSKPSGTYEAVSWGATASYQLTDDFMGFVRAATAYRAGGFNSELGNPCNVTGEIPGTTCNLIDPPLTYDPEQSLTYEIGIKSSWFDRQLIINANVYSIEYQDLLANVNNGIMANVDPINTAMFLANAGDATAEGYEIEMSIRPQLPEGWGRLGVGVSIGHQEGEFKQPPAFLTTLRAGNKLARLRPESGLATIVYSWPLGGDWQFTTSANYRYEKGGFQGAENSTVIDDFGIAGGRLALENDKWVFAVTGTNLNNQRYFTNQSGGELGNGLAEQYRLNDPRYLEASITYRW